MTLMWNLSWTLYHSSHLSQSQSLRSVISFHWDAISINVFIVLKIAVYLWMSNFTILIVNFRCNNTSITVISFDQISSVHFLISNVLSLCSTAWCISRIMRSRFTKFTCSRRCHLFQREMFDKSLLHLAQLSAWVDCNIFISSHHYIFLHFVELKRNFLSYDVVYCSLYMSSLQKSLW